MVGGVQRDYPGAKLVLSGPYLVEQVRADDRTVRRLYFMDNPLVVQSGRLVLVITDPESACPRQVIPSTPCRYPSLTNHAA
jgi:hypothetical protein